MKFARRNVLFRPTTKSATYRRDIDGLRAIAVLAVVAFHTGIPYIGGGFVGVDIFFVVSGFLITELLLKDLENGGRINFLNFYARRVRRILPMLTLVVLMTVFATFLTFQYALVRQVSKAAAAALLMSSNFYFLHISGDYFGIGADFQPLLHTWTLGVEEQFYLIWPALLAILWTLFSGMRKYIAMALGVVILASASLATVLSLSGDTGSSNMWAFYLPIARGWELCSGAFLALCLQWVDLLPRALAGVGALIGLTLIGVGVSLITSGVSFPMPLAVIPVIGAALVIVGNARCPRGPACRLLSKAPLVTIGLASYGWYLWHWPALSLVRLYAFGRPDLARDCLGSLATLIVSIATLHLYERPLRFRVGSRMSAGRVIGLGCIASLTAISIVFGAWTWAKYSPETPMEKELLRARTDTAPEADRCLLPFGSNSLPASCLAADSVQRIVLWGDSLANRLAPALYQWSRNHGSTVAIEVITKAACPPLIGALPTDPLAGWTAYYRCRSLNDLAMDRLSMSSGIRNSGVLLASAWWPRATDYDLRDIFWERRRRSSFDVHAQNTEQSLSALESFMRMTLSEITARGLRAVVILNSPILVSDWGKGELRRLDIPSCLFWRNQRDCEMSLLLHQRLSDQTNRVLKKVAAEFANVRTLDPADLLCRNDICPGEVNGIVAYTDHEHLSATMARSLTGPLTPYLDWLATSRTRAH